MSTPIALTNSRNSSFHSLNCTLQCHDKVIILQWITSSHQNTLESWAAIQTNKNQLTVKCKLDSMYHCQCTKLRISKWHTFICDHYNHCDFSMMEEEGWGRGGGVQDITAVVNRIITNTSQLFWQSCKKSIMHDESIFLTKTRWKRKKKKINSVFCLTIKSQFP